MDWDKVAGAGLVSALRAPPAPACGLWLSVRRELVALAQSARGFAVLDLQTKNVPLARFLYIFSLQVMSTGSEHRRIEGSNADPRLKRQNPAIGGVCCFGCGGTHCCPILVIESQTLSAPSIQN